MSNDMMSVAAGETALAKRLIHLKGSDADTCVPDYEDLAGGILHTTDFASTLKRVKALADEHRLLAVSLLKRKQELCACEIQAATGLTHATVSHHMSVLVDAGLVRARREGKWMYYRLANIKEFRLP